MEKELTSYMNQIGCSGPDPKGDSCVMKSGNWKEPKPEAELDGWLKRGGMLASAKAK